MKRREYLKNSALASTAVAFGLPTQESYGYTGPKDGDLQSALEILELWDKKPEHELEIYSAIYEALATDKQASFAAVVQSEKVQKLCRQHEVIHLGGPMLGCLSADGAKVWVRTTKPAQVEVKIQVENEERVFGPVSSTLESDLTAVVEVKGLPAGVSSAYRVFVDGKELVTSAKTEITTPAADPSVHARVAIGTCQHRWGLGHLGLAETLLERNPLGMLMYGDVAVQDRRDDLGMHRADYALRDFHKAWRNIVAQTPVYTSWDDHDYFDNDLSGIPKGYTDADRRGVRRVYTQAWNNEYYGLGDKSGGVFHHATIGPCDVIMTDNRYFRENKGEKNSFLGAEQMAWLKQTLLSCRAPFIILSCGTMWSDYVSKAKDSWGTWDPEGREEILSFIEENSIAGVLLISGDRHGARGFKIPRESGYHFYEFEPASLGGRSGPPATSKKWETQLYGFDNKFAFGEFTFDLSNHDDPTVTYRLVEAGGKELYEIALKRSELTPI